MGKKPYLSEKEICDAIWRDTKLHLGPMLFGEQRVTCLREREIGYRLRPDFLAFSHCDGEPRVTAFEVKITADAESVGQLANYLWVLKRHSEWWWESQINAGLEVKKGPKVEGVLIARYFDKSAYSMAEVANISLFRVVVGEDGEIELDYEEHTHEAAARDDGAIDMLSKYWGSLAVEKKSEPTNG